MATFKEAFASDKRIIAIDCDDVLCQTNATVAESESCTCFNSSHTQRLVQLNKVSIVHNELYGTDMTLDDFQHYLYWQNRCWGTPEGR
jgi:hypothetical protein